MKIFVDWGSTNFRAFLMDGERVMDRRESPRMTACSAIFAACPA